MRRAWRSLPENFVDRNAVARAVASSRVCWRGPIAPTFASVWSRAGCAGSAVQARAGADRHDVRVVVLAGELRGLDVPGQGGPHAGDLVGGDLLAVARAADHHAEGGGVGDHPGARMETEDRVVVVRVVLRRSDVHDL